MKRVGIDLGAVGGDEMATPFVHPTCPGARVYTTRDGLREMIRGGERFLDSETHVPATGYGHARALCSAPVESKVGVAGHVIYYGLCHSCSSLEAANREALRRRGDR